MLRQTQAGPITIFAMGRGIGGKFIFPVYCYLIDDLLIDSGAKVAQKAFGMAIDQSRVSLIVNTHSHEDHIGNNALVARLKGAKILVQPKAIPILADPKLLNLRGYQKFAWKTPVPSQGILIPPELKVGSHTFKVIETPGHSPDHICLHEPQEGWLFSGDLHVAEKTLVYQPHDNFHQILTSLKSLLPLNIREIYDAHRGLIPNGMQVLKEKIAYMEDVQHKVEKLHAEKVPLWEIVIRAVGKEDFFATITRGHLSKRNGVKSILRIL